MQTLQQTNAKAFAENKRYFSLPIYLVLVFGLSWPFQIAFALWWENPTLSYLLSSLSMVMVTVATFIAGRFIFQDGFARAGWRWGKPRHYIFVFALALLVFVVPTVLEMVFGLRNVPASIPFAAILGSFVMKFLLTLAPGFGEEFGWRGYLLPHLAERYSLRKALLLHGLIWWAWHIPTVVGMGAREAAAVDSAVASIFVLLLITFIPSLGNATLYAYVWNATQSLAVASVYHALYDEVRDAIEQSIGFGPLVSIWEMLLTTLFGAVLLWKGNWKNRLTPTKSGRQ